MCGENTETILKSATTAVVKMTIDWNKDLLTVILLGPGPLVFMDTIIHTRDSKPMSADAQKCNIGNIICCQ